MSRGEGERERGRGEEEGRRVERERVMMEVTWRVKEGGMMDK